MNEKKPNGIIVDDGYRRVPIYNQDGEETGSFRFNPTDVNIVKRSKKLVEELDQITEFLKTFPEAPDGVNDGLDEKRMEAMDEAQERLYKAINETFEADVASAFFTVIHPFSPVDGQPYCVGVIMAIVEYIQKEFEHENKRLDKRMSKYTKRYTK